MERKRFDASDKQNKTAEAAGLAPAPAQGMCAQRASHGACVLSVGLLRAVIVHTDGRSARTGVCRQPVRGTARRARATSRGHPTQQPSGAG